MHLDLTGKNVLVTGASRGIGRAIAVAVGKAGARVAVHYGRSTDAADEARRLAGNESRAFKADLSDAQACVQLFETVVSSFGGIDVLVNNAGVALESPLGDSMEDFTAVWDKTMAVNLRASGLLSRLAIEHFRSKAPSGGRLIHVASRAAFRGDTADSIAYAASKGGMVSMSRSIARAYGKDGICSFVIAPGWVRTDMAAEYIAANGEQGVLDEIALPRLTEPDDIAPMIVLLASGRADHATGTSIDINAGSYVH